MSYCRVCPANNRYGWPPSDLYVYLDCGGYLNCCGCTLGETSFRAYCTADMVTHVEEHKRAGHVVREDLIPALLADAAENDRWMREYDVDKEGPISLLGALLGLAGAVAICGAGGWR